MKYSVLLVLLVCLVGCGSPINPASPSTSSTSSSSGSSSSSSGSQQGQTPSPQPQTYDMLAWMTMDPSMAATQHMSGNHNPIYTNVQPDRFFWTKTGQGFPWDIQLYDNNYIYLWVTELNWQNPNTFKVFHDPVLGDYNLPLVPRFAQGGFPGSKVTIPPSNTTYETHSDCNTFTTQKLGGVVNTVWGPYQETLGGDLPANLETLVISYQYSCDSQLQKCKNKEEFHVAKPYGLVKWQHQSLQADGTYATPDNVTVLNTVKTGQVQPFTTCF
jgi:hypothetical protein